ncbi:hypothetical protein F1188_16205 [Roseospira marina]|uniref:Uncharacterized protein n=1 Tax=Roseospira marina TaxID=140057 RepID=A0A5M6I8C6_9PROT|nr:hypothetical protein [Roseospira marina]KAA5604402.1 hypothetical protein F1188_16205 [Roseospira marina]MBB4315405.1 hypothetical protein [Roseospira marina]MBB5088450.1 hypothetical protein [Roseospira marina]
MNEFDSITLLREFVSDVNAAYPAPNDLREFQSEWPDLAATFFKAQSVIEGRRRHLFHVSCVDEEGVPFNDTLEANDQDEARERAAEIDWPNHFEIVAVQTLST